MRWHYRRKKGTSNGWLIDERVYFKGLQFRRRDTFYGTKAEVEARCLEIRKALTASAEQQEPTLRNRPRNFGWILDIYREWRLERGGVDEVRYRILVRDLGEVRLDAIADHMEEYLRVLKTDVSSKTGKVLSNGSMNRLLTMANAAFNHAVNVELIKKNPLGKRRFRMLPETPRDNTLTEFQRAQLLEIIAKRAPHLLPITRYAFQVPCRKGELINMRREDLDLEHGIIRLRSGTTKNRMGCDKPIPPDMVGYFRSIPPESDYLFYREDQGRYYGLGDFKRAWLNCLKELGIKNVFHFHDTRRIAATDMLNRGTPERIVMSVGGWKTSAMLSTYYARGTALHLVKFKES